MSYQGIAPSGAQWIGLIDELQRCRTYGAQRTVLIDELQRCRTYGAQRTVLIDELPRFCPYRGSLMVYGCYCF